MSASVSFDTPILGPVVEIKDSWLDAERHLSVAHHAMVFDSVTTTALDILNAGEVYRRAMDRGFLTAQSLSTFVKQVPSGAQVRATFRLVDFDERSLHVYLELYHLDGWLAATSENQMLHMDLGKQVSVPVVGELRDDLATMRRYHRSLPPTKYMGRRIGLVSAHA